LTLTKAQFLRDIVTGFAQAIGRVRACAPELNAHDPHTEGGG